MMRRSRTDKGLASWEENSKLERREEYRLARQQAGLGHKQNAREEKARRADLQN